MKANVGPHFKKCFHPWALLEVKPFLKFESWNRICNNDNIKQNMNLKDKMHILKKKNFKKGLCACKEALLSRVCNVPHFITKIFKPRVYKKNQYSHTHTHVYLFIYSFFSSKNIMVIP
jgi:hypothetical protein